MGEDVMALEDGRGLRDEGIELAESAADAEADRALIDLAISHLAASVEYFSANEVRALCPDVRPALMGARFIAAARAGIIERAGMVQASAASRHANWMALWRSRTCSYKINWSLLYALSDPPSTEDM